MNMYRVLSRSVHYFTTVETVQMKVKINLLIMNKMLEYQY